MMLLVIMFLAVCASTEDTGGKEAHSETELMARIEEMEKTILQNKKDIAHLSNIVDLNEDKSIETIKKLGESIGETSTHHPVGSIIAWKGPLIQKDAECTHPSHIPICGEWMGVSCEHPVNRTDEGVAICLSFVREKLECGDKWFEVGNDACMCYPKDQTDCNMIHDGGEDLYQIIAGGSDVPTGWQRCDGSLIVSGTLAGTNTPNLNNDFNEGLFLRGGTDAESGTVQQDAMQDHIHQDEGHSHTDSGHKHTDEGHSHQLDSSGNHGAAFVGAADCFLATTNLEYSSGLCMVESQDTDTGAANIDWAYAQISHATSGVKGVSEGRKSDETRPKNLKVVYIMRIE